MRSLRPALTAALVLWLALPAAAQKIKFKKSPAPAVPAAPANPEEAKRSMFDAACGPDIDLEAQYGMRDRIPDLASQWNQEWVNDCWAYTGCMGVEYYQAAHKQEGNQYNRCDPAMTAVAVKLGQDGTLFDKYDSSGNRTTQFVAADSFESFPERLKKSRFPVQKGVEELCRERGCYCARPTDTEVSGPQMLAAYYKAQEIVMKHFKRALLQNAGNGGYGADEYGIARRLALELDTAGLPDIIRSALDDDTLRRLTRQALRPAAPGARPFDNRAFSEVILKQSCNPVPFPASRVETAPVSMDDKAREDTRRDPLSHRKTLGQLFAYTKIKLEAGRPVMIGFCSALFAYQDPLDRTRGDYVGTEVYGPPSPKTTNSSSAGGGNGCDSHGVIIIGRKKINGRCYLGIRNSWGKFDAKNPEIWTGSPGTLWIPAYLLLQNTFSAGTYE
jgi:hypothetical protein